MKTSPLFLIAGLLLCAACDGEQADSDKIVGRDGAFDSVLLVSTGGMPWLSAGNECGASYVNTIKVDALAATVAWDACRYDSATGHTIGKQGTRAVTSAELDALRAALLQVTIGSEDLCGYDKPNVTLDVQVKGSTGRYADSFYSCRPAPEGRTFVLNIDDVEDALWKLLP